MLSSEKYSPLFNMECFLILLIPLIFLFAVYFPLDDDDDHILESTAFEV